MARCLEWREVRGIQSSVVRESEARWMPYVREVALINLGH